MNLVCECGQVWRLKPMHFPFYCPCGKRHEGDTLMRLAMPDELPPKPTIEQALKSDERTQLEAAAKESGLLLGDAIAALTTAIGIPPCGGCEKRKQWLNAAHRWFRDRLASAQDQPRDASG